MLIMVLMLIPFHCFTFQLILQFAIFLCCCKHLTCVLTCLYVCLSYVQAVNVAGVGPFSEVILCQTPCSVPATVSVVHALRESEMMGEEKGSDEEEEEEEDGGKPTPPLYSPSTCLGLRWEAPCDHGAEITSYLIDIGERQPISTGPITKYIIQNLQPDTTYRYTQRKRIATFKAYLRQI